MTIWLVIFNMGKNRTGIGIKNDCSISDPGSSGHGLGLVSSCRVLPGPALGLLLLSYLLTLLLGRRWLQETQERLLCRSGGHVKWAQGVSLIYFNVILEQRSMQKFLDIRLDEVIKEYFTVSRAIFVLTSRMQP